MILTTTQIKEKCRVWAKQIWDLEFNLPVEVSGRMTRALGYYKYRTFGFKVIPVKLQFAKMLLDGSYKIDTVDSVILHELCHWALSQLGKPFSDGHPVFEAELRRIGASTTRTIQSAGELYEVKCSCCGDTAAKRRSEKLAMKLLDGRYTSKCCGARLTYAGKIVKEDTYVRKEAMCTEIESSIKTLQQKQGHAIPSPIQMPEVKKPEVRTTLTINDIFDTNERMTNAKMEALLKDFIIKGEAEKIRILRDTYEVTFNRALRYLGSKRNEQIKKLVG